MPRARSKHAPLICSFSFFGSDVLAHSAGFLEMLTQGSAGISGSNSGMSRIRGASARWSFVEGRGYGRMDMGDESRLSSKKRGVKSLWLFVAWRFTISSLAARIECGHFMRR